MASWYKSSRTDFLKESVSSICGKLHAAARKDGWTIPPDQDEEWDETTKVLQEVLKDPALSNIEGVLLEYDFKRRGIRIDCILSTKDLLIVIEFKRDKTTHEDLRQVENYCINLIEFHEETQSLKIKLTPLLVSRKRKSNLRRFSNKWHPNWPQMTLAPSNISAESLISEITNILTEVNGQTQIDWKAWDGSVFSPSSSIIDAAVSMYGAHDVSAIKEHAAAQESINACQETILTQIQEAEKNQEHRIVLISGAPGAGKTLVGLAIAFHPTLADKTLFITGNAPLVEVLQRALKQAYERSKSRWKVLSGFSRRASNQMIRNLDFLIQKAHRFLQSRGGDTGKESVLIFDEAQRTYAAGTLVNRIKLKKDEADSIIEQIKKRNSSVIVALLGQNQHININETSGLAWLKAAEKENIKVAVSDETLKLKDFSTVPTWGDHSLRIKINGTHLKHSMRAYRNSEIERWAGKVMENDQNAARNIAQSLKEEDAIFFTRNLKSAKSFVTDKRLGQEKMGIIASGQAHRLRSEGLFVGEKADIAPWMLAPAGDIRSCCMLEQVQNQYQIQGLEIDYGIITWDLDLRRGDTGWECWNISGGDWRRADKEFEFRLNSYRVLLTRTRKGMVIFIPKGDETGSDITRSSKEYDLIAGFLLGCGAMELPAD